MSQLKTTEMLDLVETRSLYRHRSLDLVVEKASQTVVSADPVKAITTEMVQTEVVVGKIEDPATENVKAEQIWAVRTYEDFKWVKGYVWTKEVYEYVKWKEAFSPKLTKGRDLLVWSEVDTVGEQTRFLMER